MKRMNGVNGMNMILGIGFTFEDFLIEWGQKFGKN